jgi:hypothetical protein
MHCMPQRAWSTSRLHVLYCFSVLRHTVQSFTNDPKAVGLELFGPAGRLAHSASEAAGEQTTSTEELDLGALESRGKSAQIYAVQASAVQWIFETSTDTDLIATTPRMVLEIEWLAEDDVNGVLDRLESHLSPCFDPTMQIIPLAQGWAVAFVKAMSHLHVERNLGKFSHIDTSGDIFFSNNLTVYNMHPDHDFFVLYCVVEHPIDLEITSLSLSDRMWMACICSRNTYTRVTIALNLSPL